MDVSILFAIRPIAFKGEKLLSDRWRPFVATLHNQMQQRGLEEQGSSEELMLFTFQHPFSAYCAFVEALTRAKAEIGVAAGGEALPLLVIMHLAKKGEPTPAIREKNAEVWNFLQNEALYVTRPLKAQWDQLMAGKKMPSHSFTLEGEGVYRLVLADAGAEQFHSDSLFPHRGLPWRGSQPECFYCGMKTHQPSLCPGKFMAITIRGLAEVGFMPTAKISEIYQENFTQHAKLIKAFAAGVDPAELRKHPSLLVFAAYFDIYRVYQPRFLFYLTFSLSQQWKRLTESIDNPEIDNSNLHLGLDCLRVGKYPQAAEAFDREIAKRQGRHFYAHVAQAFLALERGRVIDMGLYLDRAANMAVQEKERVYIGLLRGRYYILINDLWKAKETLEQLQRVKGDCDEISYLMVQLEARTGLTEKGMKLVQGLVSEQKEYFMVALMDPALDQVHGIVEEILFARTHVMDQAAQRNLALAHNECEDLRKWSLEQQESIQKHLTALAVLEKQFERRSYYDLIDVDGKGKTLALDCRQAREDLLDELSARISGQMKKWQRYQLFWNGYGYKPLFRDYNKNLTSIWKNLTEAAELVKKADAESFRVAAEKFAETEKSFAKMGLVLKRMILVKNFMDGLRMFLKRLVLTETILGSLAFGLALASDNILTGILPAPLLQQLASPQVQKELLFITTMVIAPIVAFCFTIWGFRDSQ